MVEENFLKGLIGLRERDALKLISDNKYTARIQERDGEHFILKADFRSRRVNLTIRKGKVANATVG